MKVTKKNYYIESLIFFLILTICGYIFHFIGSLSFCYFAMNTFDISTIKQALKLCLMIPLPPLLALLCLLHKEYKNKNI